MTFEEADRLCVGDQVKFEMDQDIATGKVTEVNWCQVRILWDDTGKHTIIHKRDMEECLTKVA